MKDVYISKYDAVKTVEKECDSFCPGKMCKLTEYIENAIEEAPEADVQLVISGDNCIVCGRDVRKDNVYYDVNGGTICESCMNTKCKCKNGR